MPEESRTEDFETVPAEEKAAEDRKKRLVADLLKQREAANKDFDEKLAKLGYHPAASGNETTTGSPPRLLFLPRRTSQRPDAEARTMEINPDDSAAWFQNGCSLRELEKYEEALAAFDRADHRSQPPPCLVLERGRIAHVGAG